MAAAAFHVYERYLYEKHRGVQRLVEKVERKRPLAEAHLQALQAQIEPHFIFNTIAHLKSLIATEPRRAEQVADERSTFLRAGRELVPVSATFNGRFRQM